MKVFIVIFLIYFANATPTRVIYRDCGSKKGTIKSLEISGCDQSKMAWCPLKKGTSVQLKITFETSDAASAVKASVHGTVGPLTVPFQLPNDDGCKNSGLKCPLTANETYSYNASLPILKSYPKFSVLVQWELKNEDGVDIICFKIPTRIV